MVTGQDSAARDTLKTSESIIPLAVDLDGTLVLTDSLIESSLILFKCNPLYIFAMLAWLLRGAAHMKKEIARRISMDVSSLPYHMNLLYFLQSQHQDDRTLVLATGADENIARQIADYLHIFDRVLASDGKTNLSGVRKRDLLVKEFGVGGFDYVGNSRKDLTVWRAARRALVVGSPGSIQTAFGHLSNVDRTFECDQADWRTYLRSLRIYQWLKNVLIFVPLVAAHRFNEISLLVLTCLAFVSFGLCASSVYVLNDLLDLPDDRRHPTKRHRPFASGTLPLATGLWMIPSLLGLSVGIGLVLPRSFLAMVGIYYALTLAYSMWLKRIIVLDVIVLATLFTMRMMAGSAAVAIWPSPWLLALSMFLFTSLALVKRYAELVIMRMEHGPERPRSQLRGKRRGTAFGHWSRQRHCCGAGSRTLYYHVVLHSFTTAATRPSGWYARFCSFGYVTFGLLLIGERCSDDPLVFALRDRISRFAIGAMAILMIVAI